jgi:hypothetical protein
LILLQINNIFQSQIQSTPYITEVDPHLTILERLSRTHNVAIIFPLLLPVSATLQFLASFCEHLYISPGILTSPDTTGNVSSSDRIATVPPPPPTHENNVPETHPPKQSATSDSKSLGEVLAPAFDAARLTTSQRLAFVAAMNSSPNPASPLADVQVQTRSNTTSPLPPYTE